MAAKDKSKPKWSWQAYIDDRNKTNKWKLQVTIMEMLSVPWKLRVDTICFLKRHFDAIVHAKKYGVTPIQAHYVLENDSKVGLCDHAQQ